MIPKIDRRCFLFGTTALAGCSGGKFTPPSVATIAADIDIIASGLASMLKALVAMKLPGVNGSLLASIETYVAGVQGVAVTLQNAPADTTLITVGDYVKSAEKYLNLIIGALAVSAIVPPPVSTYLQAAAILLPVVEATVGLVANVVAPPPAPVVITTIDQARTVLSTPVS